MNTPDVEQLRPLIESIVAEVGERKLAQALRGKQAKRTTAAPPLVGDDKQHGFRLGCDGFMSSREAREMLGGIGATTLKRRITAGQLRKGKYPGTRKVGICRRSVQQYIERMKT